MSNSGDTGTASAILDVAERLVQTRGFNAFSYADVAGELGITKPALHYHFSGKAELGQALLDRYTTRFNEALEMIDAGASDAASKLEAYAGLYARVLAQDRMCLCGMLAADFQTLPEPMRRAVIGFFDDNEKWLASVIDLGRDEGLGHQPLMGAEPGDGKARSGVFPVRVALVDQALALFRRGAGDGLAVQFQLVTHQFEAQSLGDLGLQPLDLGVEEFDDLAGAGVDQVVVVVVAGLFIAAAPVAEVMLLDHARLLEQAHGAVDGGDGDVRVDRRGAAVQLLDVGMIVGAGQHARDDAPLLGHAHAALGAEFLDPVHGGRE